MKFNIEEFLKSPKKYLQTLEIPDIIEFLNYANEVYRNTEETVISDELYDWIMEYVRKKDPKNPFLKKIGAPVKEKVKLPEWMGSLDKIRDDPKALLTWKKKYPGPYIISDKLDGISGMFAVRNNQIQLYTRGDGEYGQNVSHVLPYISKSYKKFDTNMLVRGEFIISKKNWDKIKHRGANPRNVVSGLLNSKVPDAEIAKQLEFIAYELVEPRKIMSEGLEYIQNLGFNTVIHKKIDEDSLTNEILSKYLITRRNESIYDIDGIVVSDNEKHNIVKGKNPKYAFAYKTILTHEEAEVTIYNVEWNISKDGYIKPTVHFNPVTIGGVKIQKATGFNAAYITEHKIGPGSKVIIIRSGDVIPHILRVLSPSFDNKPSLPEDIPYTWNDTHVDIMAKGTTNEMTLKQMEHFVNTLQIEFVGPGILQKLFNHKIDTIPKLFTIKKEDLLKIDGIQEKMAEKIYESLKKSLQNIGYVKIMAASNIFGRGFGEKKLQLIVDSNPELVKQILVPKLNPVAGVAAITEKNFLNKLPEFYKFLKAIHYSPPKNLPPKPKSNSKKDLDGMVIVFTGFRDKELEEKITEHGGNVTTSITKKTTLVIAADPEEDSSKLKKAKELGIKIMKREAFSLS
jgi:DNA ligase (NAD+)